MNPLTGQFLGPNSVLAIGTLVPNTGNLTERPVPAGRRASRRRPIEWPVLVVRAALRRWPTTSRGTQRIVLRGGAGLFFDRPSSTTVLRQVNNPPTSQNVTVRYGQLQTLGSGGLDDQGAPALTGLRYDSKLPSSTQWNGGVADALPWAMSLDVSYVGQHSYNIVQTA